MNEHRVELIRLAAADVHLPATFSELVVSGCPWLDGSTEISEVLGPDLVAEEVAAARLTPQQATDFFCAYNARVRVVLNPFEELQTEAYDAVCNALAKQGREDPFGEGDFWVVSDSFSDRAPTIIVFNGFRFRAEALFALRLIISRYNFVFSELRISSPEGAEVATLRAA